MRDLGGHAVQLEDRNALTPHERFARRYSQIESSEVEALESCGDVVDRTFKRRCQQRAGVVKARAAAVAPAVAEPNHLRPRRHLMQVIGMLPQMKARHPDRVAVFQNELFERAASVTGD